MGNSAQKDKLKVKCVLVRYYILIKVQSKMAANRIQMHIKKVQFYVLYFENSFVILRKRMNYRKINEVFFFSSSICGINLGIFFFLAIAQLVLDEKAEKAKIKGFLFI